MSLVQRQFRGVDVRVSFIKDVVIGPIVGFPPLHVHRLRVVVSFFRGASRLANVEVVFVEVGCRRVSLATLAVRVEVGVRVKYSVSLTVFLTPARVRYFSLAVITDSANAVRGELCLRVGDG